MCERRYTASAVTELQQIALAVELRRRAVESRRRMASNTDLARGVDVWLDELAPTPDYSRCDNPPVEPVE